MDGQDQGYNLVEALTPVLDATSIVELREAIQLTISRCVPNASLIKVFLRDPVTTHLVDENCRALPNSRFISDILQQRNKTEVTVNHNQDSIRELLGSQYSNDGNTNNSVLLLPVSERGSHNKIGLIVVVSQAVSLSSVDPKRVGLCIKQISVTYEVIRASLNKDTSPQISSLLSLMQLCGELNDQDAAKLEIKVMRYLQEQTDAESGFLLLVVPETQMLFCQAVGDSVLQEEVRFAGPTSCFGKALESKQPITLADIPMERRQEVEKIIRRQVHSLLCVPVCISDSKDLLALACVVNKLNQQEFNESDADIIRQCFKYTATVLTSTLAFQNERKLKNQTQALLQVARKLFTRLVESKKRGSAQVGREHGQARRSTCRHLHQSPDEREQEMQYQGPDVSQSQDHLTSPASSNQSGSSHCQGFPAALQLPRVFGDHLNHHCPSDSLDNTFVMLPLSAWQRSCDQLKDNTDVYASGLTDGEVRLSYRAQGRTRETPREPFSALKFKRSDVECGTGEDFFTPQSSPQKSGKKSVKRSLHTRSSKLSDQTYCQPPSEDCHRASTSGRKPRMPALSTRSCGNTSDVTPKHAHTKPDCSIGMCHEDMQTDVTSSEELRSERALELMSVFFNNMNEFGNLFSADVLGVPSSLNIPRAESRVREQLLIADMWHCLADAHRNITDETSFTHENLCCEGHGVSTQTSRRELRKPVESVQADRPLQSTRELASISPSLGKKTGCSTKVPLIDADDKDTKLLMPRFQDLHDTPDSNQISNGVLGIHRHSTESHTLITEGGIEQSLGLTATDMSFNEKSIRCPMFSTSPMASSETGNVTRPVSLVPYALSDSDSSFHSLSEDNSPARDNEGKNTKNKCKLSEQFERSAMAGKGEKFDFPCQDQSFQYQTTKDDHTVLGHLISPTKQGWLQPSWKCPEDRIQTAGAVNHSLFPSEENARLNQKVESSITFPEKNRVGCKGGQVSREDTDDDDFHSSCSTHGNVGHQKDLNLESTGSSDDDNESDYNLKLDCASKTHYAFSEASEVTTNTYNAKHDIKSAKEVCENTGDIENKESKEDLSTTLMSVIGKMDMSDTTEGSDVEEFAEGFDVAEGFNNEDNLLALDTHNFKENQLNALELNMEDFEEGDGNIVASAAAEELSLDSVGSTDYEENQEIIAGTREQLMSIESAVKIVTEKSEEIPRIISQSYTEQEVTFLITAGQEAENFGENVETTIDTCTKVQDEGQTTACSSINTCEKSNIVSVLSDMEKHKENCKNNAELDVGEYENDFGISEQSGIEKHGESTVYTNSEPTPSENLENLEVTKGNEDSDETKAWSDMEESEAIVEEYEITLETGSKLRDNHEANDGSDLSETTSKGENYPEEEGNQFRTTFHCKSNVLSLTSAEGCISDESKLNEYERSELEFRIHSQKQKDNQDGKMSTSVLEEDEKVKSSSSSYHQSILEDHSLKTGELELKLRESMESAISTLGCSAYQSEVTAVSKDDSSMLLFSANSSGFEISTERAQAIVDSALTESSLTCTQTVDGIAYDIRTPLEIIESHPDYHSADSFANLAQRENYLNISDSSDIKVQSIERQDEEAYLYNPEDNGVSTDCDPVEDGSMYYTGIENDSLCHSNGEGNSNFKDHDEGICHANAACDSMCQAHIEDGSVSLIYVETKSEYEGHGFFKVDSGYQADEEDDRACLDDNEESCVSKDHESVEDGSVYHTGVEDDSVCHSYEDQNFLSDESICQANVAVGQAGEADGFKDVENKSESENHGIVQVDKKCHTAVKNDNVCLDDIGESSLSEDPDSVEDSSTYHADVENDTICFGDVEESNACKDLDFVKEYSVHYANGRDDSSSKVHVEENIVCHDHAGGENACHKVEDDSLSEDHEEDKLYQDDTEVDNRCYKVEDASLSEDHEKDKLYQDDTEVDKGCHKVEDDSLSEDHEKDKLYRDDTEVDNVCQKVEDSLSEDLEEKDKAYQDNRDEDDVCHRVENDNLSEDHEKDKLYQDDTEVDNACHKVEDDNLAEDHEKDKLYQDDTEVDNACHKVEDASLSVDHEKDKLYRDDTEVDEGCHKVEDDSLSEDHEKDKLYRDDTEVDNACQKVEDSLSEDLEEKDKVYQDNRDEDDVSHRVENDNLSEDHEKDKLYQDDTEVDNACHKGEDDNLAEDHEKDKLYQDDTEVDNAFQKVEAGGLSEDHERDKLYQDDTEVDNACHKGEDDNLAEDHEKDKLYQDDTEVDNAFQKVEAGGLSEDHERDKLYQDDTEVDNACHKGEDDNLAEDHEKDKLYQNDTEVDNAFQKVEAGGLSEDHERDKLCQDDTEVDNACHKVEDDSLSKDHEEDKLYQDDTEVDNACHKLENDSLSKDHEEKDKVYQNDRDEGDAFHKVEDDSLSKDHEEDKLYQDDTEVDNACHKVEDDSLSKDHEEKDKVYQDDRDEGGAFHKVENGKLYPDDTEVKNGRQKVEDDSLSEDHEEDKLCQDDTEVDNACHKVEDDSLLGNHEEDVLYQKDTEVENGCQKVEDDSFSEDHEEDKLYQDDTEVDERCHQVEDESLSQDHEEDELYQDDIEVVNACHKVEDDSLSEDHEEKDKVYQNDRDEGDAFHKVEDDSLSKDHEEDKLYQDDTEVDNACHKVEDDSLSKDHEEKDKVYQDDRDEGGAFHKVENGKLYPDDTEVKNGRQKVEDDSLSEDHEEDKLCQDDTEVDNACHKVEDDSLSGNHEEDVLYQKDTEVENGCQKVEDDSFSEDHEEDKLYQDDTEVDERCHQVEDDSLSQDHEEDELYQDDIEVVNACHKVEDDSLSEDHEEKDKVYQDDGDEDDACHRVENVCFSKDVLEENIVYEDEIKGDSSCQQVENNRLFEGYVEDDIVFQDEMKDHNAHQELEDERLFKDDVENIFLYQDDKDDDNTCHKIENDNLSKGHVEDDIVFQNDNACHKVEDGSLPEDHEEKDPVYQEDTEVDNACHRVEDDSLSEDLEEKDEKYQDDSEVDNACHNVEGNSFSEDHGEKDKGYQDDRDEDDACHRVENVCFSEDVLEEVIVYEDEIKGGSSCQQVEDYVEDDIEDHNAHQEVEDDNLSKGYVESDIVFHVDNVCLKVEDDSLSEDHEDKGRVYQDDTDKDDACYNIENDSFSDDHKEDKLYQEDTEVNNEDTEVNNECHSVENGRLSENHEEKDKVHQDDIEVDNACNKLEDDSLSEDHSEKVYQDDHACHKVKGDSLSEDHGENEELYQDDRDEDDACHRVENVCFSEDVLEEVIVYEDDIEGGNSCQQVENDRLSKGHVEDDIVFQDNIEDHNARQEIEDESLCKGHVENDVVFHDDQVEDDSLSKDHEEKDEKCQDKVYQDDTDFDGACYKVEDNSFSDDHEEDKLYQEDTEFDNACHSIENGSLSEDLEENDKVYPDDTEADNALHRVEDDSLSEDHEEKAEKFPDDTEADNAFHRVEDHEEKAEKFPDDTEADNALHRVEDDSLSEDHEEKAEKFPDDTEADNALHRVEDDSLSEDHEEKSEKFPDDTEADNAFHRVEDHEEKAEKFPDDTEADNAFHRVEDHEEKAGKFPDDTEADNAFHRFEDDSLSEDHVEKDEKFPDDTEADNAFHRVEDHEEKAEKFPDDTEADNAFHRVEDDCLSEDHEEKAGKFPDDTEADNAFHRFEDHSLSEDHEEKDEKFPDDTEADNAFHRVEDDSLSEDHVERDEKYPDDTEIDNAFHRVGDCSLSEDHEEMDKVYQDDKDDEYTYNEVEDDNLSKGHVEDDIVFQDDIDDHNTLQEVEGECLSKDLLEQEIVYLDNIVHGYACHKDEGLSKDHLKKIILYQAGKDDDSAYHKVEDESLSKDHVEEDIVYQKDLDDDNACHKIEDDNLSEGHVEDDIGDRNAHQEVEDDSLSKDLLVQEIMYLDNVDDDNACLNVESDGLSHDLVEEDIMYEHDIEDDTAFQKEEDSLLKFYVDEELVYQDDIKGNNACHKIMDDSLLKDHVEMDNMYHVQDSACENYEGFPHDYMKTVKNFHLNDDLEINENFLNHDVKTDDDAFRTRIQRSESHIESSFDEEARFSDTLDNNNETNVAEEKADSRVFDVVADMDSEQGHMPVNVLRNNDKVLMAVSADNEHCIKSLRNDQKNLHTDHCGLSGDDIKFSHETNGSNQWDNDKDFDNSLHEGTEEFIKGTNEIVFDTENSCLEGMHEEDLNDDHTVSSSDNNDKKHSIKLGGFLTHEVEDTCDVADGVQNRKEACKYVSDVESLKNTFLYGVNDEIALNDHDSLEHTSADISFDMSKYHHLIEGLRFASEDINSVSLEDLPRAVNDETFLVQETLSGEAREAYACASDRVGSSMEFNPVQEAFEGAKIDLCISSVHETFTSIEKHSDGFACKDDSDNSSKSDRNGVLSNTSEENTALYNESKEKDRIFLSCRHQSIEAETRASCRQTDKTDTECTVTESSIHFPHVGEKAEENDTFTIAEDEREICNTNWLCSQNYRSFGSLDDKAVTPQMSDTATIQGDYFPPLVSDQGFNTDSSFVKCATKLNGTNLKFDKAPDSLALRASAPMSNEKSNSLPITCKSKQLVGIGDICHFDTILGSSDNVATSERIPLEKEQQHLQPSLSSRSQRSRSVSSRMGRMHKEANLKRSASDADCSRYSKDFATGILTSVEDEQRQGDTMQKTGKTSRNSSPPLIEEKVDIKNDTDIQTEHASDLCLAVEDILQSEIESAVQRFCVIRELEYPEKPVMGPIQAECLPGNKEHFIKENELDYHSSPKTQEFGPSEQEKHVTDTGVDRIIDSESSLNCSWKSYYHGNSNNVTQVKVQPIAATHELQKSFQASFNDTECRESTEFIAPPNKLEKDFEVSCTFDSDLGKSNADSLMCAIDSNLPETLSHETIPLSGLTTRASASEQDSELSRSSQESSQPDVTEFEESNLSSEESAFEADVSSFDATLLAPSSANGKTKVKTCQTLKYCLLATARKSTCAPLNVVKFPCFSVSENSEDSCEDRNVEDLPGRSDQVQECGSQWSPQELPFIEKDEADASADDNLKEKICHVKQNEGYVEAILSPLQSPKKWDNKSGSSKERRNRYSSFLGISPAASSVNVTEPTPPCPVNHDDRIGSFILPHYNNQSYDSDRQMPLHLPPKSHRKKSKDTHLRKLCLEKSTSFPQKQQQRVPPGQKSEKVCRAQFVKEVNRTDVEAPDSPGASVDCAENESTMSGSGSILLESCYYTDSCDSEGNLLSPAAKWWETPTPALVSKLALEDRTTLELGGHSSHARKNLQQLFSTPKAALVKSLHSISQESDSELFKVSPISDRDHDEDRSEQSQRVSVSRGGHTIDLLGMSGIEFFPDEKLPLAKGTMHCCNSSPPAEKDEANIMPNSCCVTEAKVKSPKKTVSFLLPDDSSQSPKTTSNITSSKTKLSVETFPTFKNIYRPTHPSSLDVLMESSTNYDFILVDYNDDNCQHLSSQGHSQSLELNYDPFMASQKDSLWMKQPRLSVIFEEEQESYSSDLDLDLPPSLNVSTVGDSFNSSDSTNIVRECEAIPTTPAQPNAPLQEIISEIANEYVNTNIEESIGFSQQHQFNSAEALEHKSDTPNLFFPSHTKTQDEQTRLKDIVFCEPPEGSALPLHLKEGSAASIRLSCPHDDPESSVERPLSPLEKWKSVKTEGTQSDGLKSTQHVDLNDGISNSTDTIHLHISLDIEGLESSDRICTCANVGQFGARENSENIECLVDDIEKRSRMTPQSQTVKGNTDTREPDSNEKDNASKSALFETLAKECSEFMQKSGKLPGNTLDIESCTNNCPPPEEQVCSYRQACLAADETGPVPQDMQEPLLVWRSLSDDDEEENSDAHEEDYMLNQRETSKGVNHFSCNRSFEERETLNILVTNDNEHDEDYSAPSHCSVVKDTLPEFCDAEKKGARVNQTFTMDMSLDCGDKSSTDKSFDKDGKTDCEGFYNPSIHHKNIFESDNAYQMSSEIESGFTEESRNCVSIFGDVNKGYFTLQVTVEGEEHNHSSDEWMHCDVLKNMPEDHCEESQACSIYQDEVSRAEFNNAFHVDDDALEYLSFVDNDGYENDEVKKNGLECNRDRDNPVSKIAMQTDEDVTHTECLLSSASEEDNQESDNVEDYSEDMSEFGTDFTNETFARKHSSDSSASDPDILSHTSSTISDSALLYHLTGQTTEFSVQDQEGSTLASAMHGDRCKANLSCLEEARDTKSSSELYHSRVWTKQEGYSELLLNVNDSATVWPDCVDAFDKKMLYHCSDTNCSYGEDLFAIKSQFKVSGLNVPDHMTYDGASERAVEVSDSIIALVPRVSNGDDDNEEHGEHVFNVETELESKRCRQKADVDERGDRWKLAIVSKEGQSDCGLRSYGSDDFEVSPLGLFRPSGFCDSDVLLSDDTGSKCGEWKQHKYETETDHQKQRLKTRYHKFFIGNCDPDPSFCLSDNCREPSRYVNRGLIEESAKCVLEETQYHSKDNSASRCQLDDHHLCAREQNVKDQLKESFTSIPLSAQCSDHLSNVDTFYNQHCQSRYIRTGHVGRETEEGIDTETDFVTENVMLLSDLGAACGSSKTFHSSLSRKDNDGAATICGTARADSGSRTDLFVVKSPDVARRHSQAGLKDDTEDCVSPPEQPLGNACPKLRHCLRPTGRSPEEICSPLSMVVNSSVESGSSLEGYSPSDLDLAAWSPNSSFEEYGADPDTQRKQTEWSYISEDTHVRYLLSRRRKATMQMSFGDLMGLPSALREFVVQNFQESENSYDLTKLLREIMQEARNLTDAERCSVFLIDNDTDELVAMVFDGITADDKEVQGEIRLPKTQGIAGHVATTGTLLNIRDAYSHPLFYRGIDDSTGFRTRNILCFPIKDEEGVVLGVAQLCNKKTFQFFTTFDEDIASAFAVYCCISISHSLMYKKVIDIQYRNSLANELMMFHMKSLMYKKLVDTQHRQRIANELVIFHINQQVPAEEVSIMASVAIPPIELFGPNFDSFDFAPRTVSESQTVVSCLSMFEDLGFISRWRIKIDTLVRFLLMVKKGYRNPPYHNWMHAYAVTHFCYLLIKNLHLHNYLEDIELLALFVSCLCHDIDHRGTTNSFQVQSQSVLAALYSSEGSVMERHHLAQSMCILNTEGSNLFENLSSKEYQTVLDLMRDIILATDLAHHLRTVKEQEELAQSGAYDKTDARNKHILLCLLMTACDLSDQTKNWNNTKYIAALVYQEFFSQGDLEKALGKNPLEMMDRERACIPELQISFLDNIAAPVYRILAAFFQEAQTPMRNVEENRKHWVHIGQLLKRHGNPTQAMSVEQIISIEEEESPPNSGGQVNGR